MTDLSVHVETKKMMKNTSLNTTMRQLQQLPTKSAQTHHNYNSKDAADENTLVGIMS